LSKEQTFKQLLQGKKAHESLTLSSRSVTFRGEVFNLNSGGTFSALQDVISEDQSIYQSRMILKSDQIMYKVIDQKN
jgi:hypothetical protein